MADSTSADRSEILQRHKDWWEANAGLDIPRMASVFPTGMNYLMFNLNGHAYFGIDEKIELWKWYQKELEITMPDIRIMKFEISRDMAWIACEGVFPLRVIGERGTGSETWLTKKSEEQPFDPFMLRATEIYHRDDGDGGPKWTMWHFHCSPMPPADEERPLGGTPAERGLGGNPWGEPLRVVGT